VIAVRFDWEFTTGADGIGNNPVVVVSEEDVVDIVESPTDVVEVDCSDMALVVEVPSPFELVVVVLMDCSVVVVLKSCSVVVESVVVEEWDVVVESAVVVKSRVDEESVEVVESNVVELLVVVVDSSPEVPVEISAEVVDSVVLEASPEVVVVVRLNEVSPLLVVPSPEIVIEESAVVVVVSKRIPVVVTSGT
jgi:hypothetical protein